MPGLLSRAITYRNELLAFEKIKNLVQKDRRRARRSQMPGTRLQPLLSNEIEDAAVRERLLNDMVARHLEAARVRAEAGKRPTQVQKRAKNWLIHNQWVARQSAPRTAWAEEEEEEEEYELTPGETVAERNRDREFRQATAADRVEAERLDLYGNATAPPYEPSSIPAPTYRGRKTKWRTLKSKMTKLLTKKKKKTSSPAPGYTPGLPPDYAVGGSRRSNRRSNRRRKTYKSRR
jgi:hypothetical protein